MTSPYRFRVGADENGLGPRLGPMLTTAVLAEMGDKGHATVERKVRGKMRSRLGDSKALVAHGDIALAEAWTRVLVEMTTKTVPATVRDLVDALSLEPPAAMRGRCPKHVEGQCWNEREEAFEADPKLLALVRKDIEKLAAGGVRIMSVRSAIVCAKHLNEEVDRGRTRFAVDLHAMERLVLGFRDECKEDVLAILGKVGGYTQYETAFGPLNGRLCSVVQEKRAKSTYRFPGVGELSFVMDADATDRLVSIASLVGKYLREVLMARIVRHYQASKPELPVVSGYHDAVTTQFIDGTKLLRKKQKIPDDCFERRALGTG
ncbi:MAG: hypothetical protein HOW73_50365 [Polyangiaceae bacterium]|nr:hypothetical protein [Polyangiaceae bacterium]